MFVFLVLGCGPDARTQAQTQMLRGQEALGHAPTPQTKARVSTHLDCLEKELATRGASDAMACFAKRLEAQADCQVATPKEPQRCMEAYASACEVSSAFSEASAACPPP